MPDRQQRERPNVVLIMADGMGYSGLGCCGSQIRAPQVDAPLGRRCRPGCIRSRPVGRF